MFVSHSKPMVKLLKWRLKNWFWQSPAQCLDEVVEIVGW